MPQDASTAANRSEENPEAAAPWSPLVLGVASVLFTAGFSSLWGGAMASLNRRRLDPPKIAWGPLLVGLLALGTSIATSVLTRAPWWMSPYSRIVWLVRLGLWDAWIWWLGPAMEVVCCIFIVLVFVLPQRRRYQAWRAAGGRRSSVAVPVLAGIALTIGSMSLDVFSQGRFFAAMADTAYRQGLEKVADGRHDEALEDFNRAIRLDPTQAEAFLQRARLRASRGKDQEALKDYDRAVELRPDDLDFRLERAELAVAIGDDQRAIEDTDKIIKAQPDFGLVLYIACEGVRASGEAFQEALNDLNAAVKSEPKSALFHFERGRVQLELERPDGPSRTLPQQSTSVPGDPIYHYYRARAYREKQEWQKAVDDLSQVLKQAPMRFDLYWFRINIYLDVGQSEKAQADCNTVLDLIEKYGKSEPGAKGAIARTLGYRARSYVRMNDLKKASDDADRAIELNPKSAGGWLARGLAELAQGKPAEAEANFTKTIELAPTQPANRARALYYRGQARKELGQTEQGEADQLEAKQLFPDVSRARRFRAKRRLPRNRKSKLAYGLFSGAGAGVGAFIPPAGLPVAGSVAWLPTGVWPMAT